MIIKEEDSRLLLRAINEGEAVLLLGAGASATSTNVRGPIKQGRTLAKHLAEKSGLPYSNETLPDVVGAVLASKISAAQFHQILKDEYTRVSPSPELLIPTNTLL